MSYLVAKVERGCCSLGGYSFSVEDLRVPGERGGQQEGPGIPEGEDMEIA